MRRSIVRQTGLPFASRALLAALVALLMVGPLVGGFGAPATTAARSAVASLRTATGPTPAGGPSQPPTLAGMYLLDGGLIVAALGYAGFGGLWYGVGANGTEIYASSLWLILYDTGLVNLTIHVTVEEPSAPKEQQTLVVGSHGETESELTLQPRLAWTTVLVDMEGVVWTGLVSVPASLIPLQDLDLGGLDLLVLGVLSEAIVGFTVASWAARLTMKKRMLAAPPYKVYMWGHVWLAAIFTTVLVNYGWIDQTFAGWSPLLYVLPLVGMWYLASLWPFDTSKKREVWQLAMRPGQELKFRRYLLRVAYNAVGDLVAIGESWPAAWARFWGHYVVLERDADPRFRQVFVAPVENLASPTGTVYRAKGRSKLRERLGVGAKVRTDGFKVVNEQADGVTELCFIKPGPPLFIRWPRLSFHRPYTTDPEFNEAGLMVRAPEVRQKLSWPHYVEGSAETLDWEEPHYKYAVAAAFDVISKSDLARMYGETAVAFESLRSEFETRVGAEVDARLASHYAFVGFTRRDLSGEEAAEEATAGGDAPPRPRRANVSREALSG